eukprot:IDg13209t1
MIPYSRGYALRAADQPRPGYDGHLISMLEEGDCRERLGEGICLKLCCVLVSQLDFLGAYSVLDMVITYVNVLCFACRSCAFTVVRILDCPFRAAPWAAGSVIFRSIGSGASKFRALLGSLRCILPRVCWLYGADATLRRTARRAVAAPGGRLSHACVGARRVDEVSQHADCLAVGGVLFVEDCFLRSGGLHWKPAKMEAVVLSVVCKGSPYHLRRVAHIGHSVLAAQVCQEALVGRLTRGCYSEVVNSDCHDYESARLVAHVDIAVRLA